MRTEFLTFGAPNIQDQEILEVVDTLKSGWIGTGPKVRRFEQDFAHYQGVPEAVALSSGSAGLHLACLSLNLKPGDEVITVAHTFAATVSAIVHSGATPILVDVTNDFNIDVAAAERAVTKRTRAIIPVHLNGRLCDMDPVLALAKRHGLAVIEDACQALGATYRGRMAGSFGTGCFSFYPFKSLGGFGDGGALTTNDPEVARAATLLRYNGEDRETGEFHYHGYTALLDNVQAAVLDVKLRHFPRWVEHRRAMAERYRERLAGIPQIHLPHFEGAAFRDGYQNYVIRAARRDDLRTHLTGKGIETLVSWPKPLWAHAKLGLGEPDLPVSKRICSEVLSLPMSAETTPEHVDLTADAIRRFYA